MMNVDAKKCIVVEDSILGIEAANSAGMRSFWYRPNNFDRSNYLGNEDVVCFKNMLELPELISASQGAE